MKNNKLVYATFIDTTPEKLWEALTSGEFTKMYWNGEYIESDWRVGSPVQMFRDSTKVSIGWRGEILESNPPTKLSYTFQVLDAEGNSNEEPSRVTFEIEQFTDVVRLTVTHVKITNGFESLQNGWMAIISSLKSTLETGKPLSKGIWEWHINQGVMCAE